MGFKGVPADVCENCGEYYVSESVTQELLRRAEAGDQNGTEVEVLAYAEWPRSGHEGAE